VTLEFQRKPLICYISYFNTNLVGIKGSAKKLSDHPNAVSYLVTLIKGPISDSTGVSKKILMELSEIDKENVAVVAQFGW